MTAPESVQPPQAPPSKRGVTLGGVVAGAAKGVGYAFVGNLAWWRRPFANLSAVMARPTRAPARVETFAEAVRRHGLGVDDLQRIERGLAREARIAGAMLAVVGLAFLFLPWSPAPVWHLIGCSMAGAWCLPTWLRAAFRRDQVRARELFTLREWLGLGGPARRF